MVKAIKKFTKEYYDCISGLLLFIIGSFLFFEVLVNRYCYSTWGVWRVCLLGNIPGPFGGDIYKRISVGHLFKKVAQRRIKHHNIVSPL